MKVTKRMEDGLTFCKNGGGKNTHHNGRNSQVSGDGFKKEGKKKQWDKILHKVLKH